MKVAQTNTAPIPERKPEPPPAGDVAASFRAMLGQAKPGATGLLSNGQKAPPPPAEKPPAPIQLADGTTVPFPARKPTAPEGDDAISAAVRIAGGSSERSEAAHVVLAAQQVAGLSGHSFSAILAQATQESGLDPSARNRTSSAAGPFQILDRTWLGLFRRYGAAYGLGDLASAIHSRNGVPVVKDAATRQKILDLRHDVDLSAGMAARYLAEGRQRLERSLKRPVTETESRIAYVMGAGGAARLIRAAESNPRTSAADLLPSAAKSNHGLFYDRESGRALTAAETVARLTHRMESDQKDMFARIAQAAEPRRRLDGGPSPLSAYQTAALAGDLVGDPVSGDDTGAA